jgi:hypothetical protein
MALSGHRKRLTRRGISNCLGCAYKRRALSRPNTRWKKHCNYLVRVSLSFVIRDIHPRAQSIERYRSSKVSKTTRWQMNRRLRLRRTGIVLDRRQTQTQTLVSHTGTPHPVRTQLHPIENKDRVSWMLSPPCGPRPQRQVLQILDKRIS